MTKLTKEDCALNAAEALTKATADSIGREYAHGLLGVADTWIRLLDTMTRAGMAVAERADGQVAS